MWVGFFNILYSMYYTKNILIDTKIGNNSFAYAQRISSFGEAKIVVPGLIDGTLDDVVV